MKFAALSDIHSNIAALDAVLADIAARGIERIVNLGDIASGGLFPRETAERLMPLSLPTIKGNHERQLLTLCRDQMGASDRYAAELLTEDQIVWLAELPERLWLFDDVLLVHGTPESDLEYFLETVTEDGVREATQAEITARAEGVDASVILCGHAHLPRVVRLGDGRLIVNPGSVGLPAYDDDRPYPHRMEAGTPHAHYAVVEEREGSWTAELISVAYDWEKAARQAESNGRPDLLRPLLVGKL